MTTFARMAVLAVLLSAGVDARAAPRQAAAANPASALVVATPELQRLKRESDWIGLERASRDLLPGPLRATAATPTDSATVTLWLGDALEGQGRFGEAEAAYRRGLALRTKALGRSHPDTALALEDVGLTLMDQGHNALAERLIRRSHAIVLKALGPDSPEVARGESSLGRVLRQEGRLTEAEPHFRRSLAIREKALAPDDLATATSLNNLAVLLWSKGELPEAETLMRRALAIRERILGPDDPNTALAVGGLALIINDAGRNAESEPLYRRALAATEKAKGPNHPDAAMVLTNLGSVLWDEGKTGEVEGLFRRALSIREATLGPDHPDTAMSVNNLAFVLESQGRHAEAEALYRRALAIDQRALGPAHPDTAIVMRSIGELLQDRGRFADAEPLFRDAAAAEDKVLGPDHPDTAAAYQSLGLTAEKQRHYADATTAYRRACAPRAILAGGADLIGEAASTAKVRSSRCSVRLALSQWGWSAAGGGTRREDRPDALRREAFLTAQRSTLSAAGEALAKSAGLTAAAAIGVGDDATAYEAALQERGRLDQAFAGAAGETGEDGVKHRAALTRAREEILRRIDAVKARLIARAPRYWDYRSPQPIDLAALQATSGPDAVLLDENEALIVFMVPPGEDRGLVFAVSKTRFAWARIGLSGDALTDLVRAVRKPIEKRYRSFDRQSAHELYVALLGDQAIQKVISETPSLLLVPAGPLTSLPPGLLVTAPPKGGTADDADPDALRATPWLLRAKAVTLLPSVSSLRTLRQLTPLTRAQASEPLLAFADPDFGGAASLEDLAGSAPRKYEDYSVHNVSTMREALRGLPRLPGTLIEGRALMSALDAPAGSLLTGSDASKAELMARNADGRLARVKVLEFATHGLVAGAATWLAEPALALAAGRRPEDELLLASEASTLKLNAEWVLLSACNTASPDAPEAEGLSGLSRAFFFAGARSLLVSHWPVRDDIAARLVPEILQAERTTPGLSRAEAVRRASLAVLDDPTLHAANPSAWAVFSLIGQSGP